MWLTALILGFAGSLHCIGMCSPLAMAVTSMTPTILLNRVLYNSGRVLTYGIFGATAASLGYGLPLIKYQNVLSIFLGLTLLLIGITGTSKIQIPFVTKVLASFSSKLKSAFATFLQKKNYGSILLMGTLNGLLPCGLTFMGIIYSTTLAGPIDGFNFMLLVGVGTLPAMLGFTSALQWFIKQFHLSMRSVTTSMLIISGVLLIARVLIVHLPHATTTGTFEDIILCK